MNINDLESHYEEGKRSVGSLKSDLHIRKLHAPAPWEKHYSEEFGSHYYFNPVTGDSSWEFPVQTMHVSSLDDDVALVESLPCVETSITNHCIRDKSVVDRSEEMLKSKADKIALMRDQLNKQEMQEIQSKPIITRTGSKTHRSVQDMLAWEQSRKAKLQEIVTARRLQEEAEFTGFPKVTKVADALSKKWTSETNPSESDSMSVLPVEERLLQYEERKRFKLEMLKQEQEQNARLLSVPTIAPHSMTLERHGDVSERLYNLASKQQIEKASTAGQSSLQHDQITGQRLFQPRLNPTSERIVSRSRPAVPVEVLLTHRGEQTRIKLQQKEQRLQLRAKELSETASRMNPVSERLAARRVAKEVGVDVSGISDTRDSSRLSDKGIGRVKTRTLQSIEEHSFKPSISKGSRQILADKNYYCHQHQRHLNGQESIQQYRRYEQRDVMSESYDEPEYYCNSSNVANSHFDNEREVDEHGLECDEDELSRSARSQYYRHSNVSQGHVDERMVYGADDRNLQDVVEDYYTDQQFDGLTLNFDNAANSDDYRLNYDTNSSTMFDPRDSLQYDDEMTLRSSAADNNNSRQSQGTSVYARSTQWDTERQRRLERERLRRQQDELSQCSFKPTTGSNSRPTAGNNRSKATTDSSSIVERHTSWVQKRDEKIALERQRALDAEMKDCSFVPRPHIHKASNDSATGKPLLVPPHLGDNARSTPSVATNGVVGRVPLPVKATTAYGCDGYQQWASSVTNNAATAMTVQSRVVLGDGNGYDNGYNRTNGQPPLNKNSYCGDLNVQRSTGHGNALPLRDCDDDHNDCIVNDYLDDGGDVAKYRPMFAEAGNFSNYHFHQQSHSGVIPIEQRLFVNSALDQYAADLECLELSDGD